MAGFFVMVSFFTKQDGGGLAFMLCTVLAGYKSITTRNAAYVAAFVTSFLLATTAAILPFLPHEFTYWFNYGQEPHYSRMDLGDIVDEFLGASQWIKFYMVVATLLYINKLSHWKDILSNSRETLFYLLTMGILVQATIIQITSYIPADNNIYFHSFALAYALHAIQFKFSFSRLTPLIASIALVFFWWSGTYYKYVQRIAKRYFPKTAQAENSAKVVSRDTYDVGENANNIWKGVNMAAWVELPNSKAFERINMPEETVAGIEKLRKMPLFNSDTQPRVLNMTELTPLAHELGFELERGVPMWYHLNVSMFDRELAFYKERVASHYYDVVLFEYIPTLNNFYPFELRDLLLQEYERIDSFMAPRQQTDASVEVYIRKRN